MGEAPEGDRLVSLIHAMLRIENCGMMAAEEAVGKSLGYDIEVLKENPYGHNKIGKTNLMILDDIRNITVEIIREILGEKKYQTVVEKIKEYKIIDESYILLLEKNILEIALPIILETKRESKNSLAVKFKSKRVFICCDK